jgi:PKD repeat protein
MKTNNSFVIIFFYLISVKIAVSQVAWPLSQFNEQHAVVGSVGEYRNTNRFHRGTDISGTGNVYAINSGEVTDITDEGTNNETVWVGNIAYVHVVHSIGIKKGKTVTAGVTVLGTVYSNHVHIQQNNFNFLSHGLSPYVDNISPVINYVEFRQNGADLYTATTLYNKVVTINDVDYTMLYDKVDIIADAKDPGDNGSRMAPISLSYLILNSAGIPVDDWVNSFNFRFTPENTRTRNCFYSGTIQAGVFKYILTSSPNTGPADRYLLTRLDKKNAPQTSWPNNNSLAAPCNIESYYSDGIYSISVAIFDADYENSTNNNNTDSEIKQIIIDNFCPYISRVKIYESGNSTTNYNRGWVWTGDDLQLEPLPNSDAFGKVNYIIVEVSTSEPMKWVKLTPENRQAQQINCGTDLNKTKWEFVIPMSGATPGQYKLDIEGEDLAGNLIQDKPSEIPIRGEGDTWDPPPSLQHIDKYHSFIYGSNGVDFTAEQSGYFPTTIQFNDKSSITGAYSWNFGDNSTSTSKNPLKNYTNYGVFAVTHSVTNNGTQYSITKPVSVSNITAPNIKGIWYARKATTGKSSSVFVDLYSDCEGIIGSYIWKLDGVLISNDANPIDVPLNEFTLYTVELTVSNAAGNALMTEQIYIDPDSYPYASIQDWEVTYFVHDLEVSTDNFKENEPLMFTIDYGDGITETYLENYYSYHTFTHNYYELGEYIVKVTVAGQDDQGKDIEVRTAKRIRVQPYDLVISLSTSSLQTPPQPKEKISCTATITEGASGGAYHGSWGIYRVGDPDSYHAELFQSVAQIPAFEYTPNQAGQYKIMLDVIVDGFATSGYAGQQIKVVNAPKYVDANISSDSYLLSLNSEYSLFGSVWPTGDPGVPEEDWNPTNIRWTLKGPQTNIVENITFPYDVYYFAQYFTHKFEYEGMYTLQLETWNKEHQYSVDDLDTSNNCRLSYYNYIIKEINVSANIPSLKIVDPLSCYIQANRDAEVHDIIISNPSSTPINWNAEVQYIDQSNWLHISITSGVSLCCANQQSVTVAIDANSGEGSRYGLIKITGKDSDGNEVQGSPSYVQIGQYGIEGPPYDIVEGTYPDLKFGSAVAIDGRTAVVGSPNSSNIKGQAYIYSKSDNGEWDRISVLLSSDNNSEFGSYVDISGDYASVLGSDKAYFFSRGNSGWGGVTVEFKSQPVNGPKSLTMWGDYAVVGSPFYNSDRGKVTIFYRNQGGVDNWGIVKELYGDNAGDKFGYSIDLYNDKLVVGAPKGGQGYMKIFNRNLVSGNDWGLEQKIVAPGFDPGESGTSDFGKAVTIFQDNVSTTYYRYCEPGSGGAMYYGPVLFSITYLSSEIGNWEEVVRDIVQDRPAGNNVTSATMYKLNEPIENEESFISGFGYPIQEYVLANGTDGSFGSVLITKAKCVGPWDYCRFDNLQSQNPYSPNPDEKYGSSVSFSYAGNVTGISGYDSPTANNVGGAIFEYNNYLGNNLCEAEIDLNLINFTKPSGTYPDVIARNICLGGRALPATIESGANIKYEAKEILLQDGFLAENGSIFTAEAQNCESGNSDSPAKIPNNQINFSEWPLSEQSRTQLLKVYMRVYPDFPWETFDLGNAVDFMKPETKSTVYQNSQIVDKSVQHVGFNEPVMSELPVLLLNNAEIKLGIGKIKKSTKNSN